MSETKTVRIPTPTFTVAPAGTGRGSARYALGLMIVISFLHAFDRFMVPPILPLIQHKFGFSDWDLGLLNTAYSFVYALAALPVAAWADRGVRSRIIAAGVSVWSIATAFTGLAASFVHLFVTRAVVGIGEVTFQPASTSLLSDYFPRRRRGRVMGYLGAGMLLGIAFGYGLGGVLGEKLGWQMPFFIACIPGLVCAALAYFLVEPRRGAADAADVAGPAQGEPAEAPASGMFRSALILLRTPTVRLTLVASTAAFFAFGSWSVYLPTYLDRQFHQNTGQAGIFSGIVIMVSGLAGMIFGGFVADLALRYSRNGRMLVAAIAFTVSVPASILAITSGKFILFAVCFFLMATALNFYRPAFTALQQEVVVPQLRAQVVAVSMAIQFLLGESYAALVVGGLSDHFGGGAHATTGASLQIAFLLTSPPALAISAIACWIGLPYVARDLDRPAGA